MVTLPRFKTKATDELCREIAKKSKGVCFLGFSRGKDSLCAWLFLKRYFKVIIPFHCASYPGLEHVKNTLDYYELMMCDKAKGEKILRLVGEELPMSLARMMYQIPDYIDSLEENGSIPDYSKLDIVEELRYTFNFPKAWCAFGISASDSIDRRIYVNKVQGRNPQNLTFYPCYDWPRAEILNAVRESGLKLSGEYKWACRTLGGVPSATCNRIYKEHYPEDWERIQAMYPLCEAKTIRERFLDLSYKRRVDSGVIDTTKDDDDDGSDVMAELEGENN